MAVSLPTLEWPVACREAKVGGGRGIFVVADVPAGQVLLSEVPLLHVPSEDVAAGDSWHTAFAKHILQSDRRDQIIAEIGLLHPQRLDDVPTSALELFKQENASATRSLLEMPACNLTQDNVLVLLLKLRMNALTMGLHLKISMVNHDCFPNSMLFAPGERAEGLSDAAAFQGKTELVATRAMRAGEEVLISFIGSERSAARRQVLFAQQHFDALAPSNCNVPLELEAFLPEVDASEAKIVLASIEEQLDYKEFKDRLQHADKRERSLRSETKTQLADLVAIAKKASGVLHPRHLVLCRIFRLISHASQILLAFSNDVKLAEQLIHASHEVLATQKLFLCDTHPDVAEASEHLAAGLAVMLACDRHRLFAAYADKYPDFRTASIAEAALRKQAKHIRELYSVDVIAASAKSQKRKVESLQAVSTTPETVGVPSDAGEDWSIFE